jgi:NAD(P)-dependent dehydrogenase (short-subunit alcohol dehydrogenase family)
MFIATEQGEEDSVSPQESKSVGRTSVVIGGTKGIGREIVASLAARGSTVFLSGRTRESGQKAAAEIGLGTIGIGVDLSEPEAIAQCLADIESVDDLVSPAIERDANTIADYNIARALRLVTLKLVGYAEAVHALRDRFTPNASVVLFGGLALERPYPGSTTVSTVNGGIVGLVHSLASELAPVRVNAIHPGIVGDSPFWENKDNSPIISRTPLGRLVTMQEIVGAVEFLLDNTGVNGVSLALDGGWLLK